MFIFKKTKIKKDSVFHSMYYRAKEIIIGFFLIFGILISIPCGYFVGLLISHLLGDAFSAPSLLWFLGVSAIGIGVWIVSIIIPILKILYVKLVYVNTKLSAAAKTAHLELVDRQVKKLKESEKIKTASDYIVLYNSSIRYKETEGNYASIIQDEPDTMEIIHENFLKYFSDTLANIKPSDFKINKKYDETWDGLFGIEHSLAKININKSIEKVYYVKYKNKALAKDEFCGYIAIKDKKAYFLCNVANFGATKDSVYCFDCEKELEADENNCIYATKEQIELVYKEFCKSFFQ